ncbi:MAG: glycosyltransferase [Nitrososphaerota archaeon]|nr:glycosyltransferase [Nitrososphaerota archaeon]
MPNSPRISVIMPNFNKSSYIGEAIESVLTQTYQDFELIIIDDCSTDSSIQVIDTFRRRDSRIHLIRHLRNLGVSKARNDGLAYSSGRFVSFLDSDDVYASTRLDAQMRILSEREKPVVVYTDWFEIDSSGYIVVPFHDDAERSEGMWFPYFLVGTTPTASIMFPRTCLDKVGLFDESLHSSEDVDFSLRLAKSFPFAYIPLPLYGYRVYSGNFVRRDSRAMNFRWKTIVLEKHVLGDLSSLDSRTRKLAYDKLFARYLSSGQYTKLLRVGITKRYGLWSLLEMPLRSRFFRKRVQLTI